MQSYFWVMFIRKNKNRSGSISIQIAHKIGRTNKIITSIGVAKTAREEELLMQLARTEMERIQDIKHRKNNMEMFNRQSVF